MKQNWCDTVIDAPNLSSSRTVRHDCHSAVVSLPLALDTVRGDGRIDEEKYKKSDADRMLNVSLKQVGARPTVAKYLFK